MSVDRQALYLLVVFGALLGPARVLADLAEAPSANGGRRLAAARAVGWATLLLVPAAVVGVTLPGLGFLPSALAVALALLLLADALHRLWGAKAAPFPAALGPATVAVVLLFPATFNHGPPSVWLVTGVLALVMAANLLALLTVERARRWIEPPALMAIGSAFAVLTVAFAVQSMAHALTDLACNEIVCSDDAEPDPALRQARQDAEFGPGRAHATLAAFSRPSPAMARRTGWRRRPEGRAAPARRR